MVNSWQKLKLGELVESVSKTFKFKDESVCFLNTSDVYNGKVLVHDLVSPSGLPGQAKKSIQKGDLLYSEIRPANKRFALVNFEASNYVVSTKLMVLRPYGRVTPEYLLAFLTSKQMLRYLQVLAEDRSGTFPQITFDIISSLSIDLPPLQEQKAIAEVLTSLDDKIELLQKQNETLEALAQTLFRQWFIEEADDSWEEVPLTEIAHF